MYVISVSVVMKKHLWCLY